MFDARLPHSAGTLAPSAAIVDTLAAAFDAQCVARADHLAYAFLDQDLAPAEEATYRRLRIDTQATAAWLSQHTRAGDRVLLALPPGLGFVRAFWACLISGRVAVPVPAPDPIRLHHAAPRLRSVVADSRATVVLTSHSLRDAAAATLDAATFASAPWLAVPQPQEIASLVFAAERPPILPATVAYLQYTSGSTSAPRGVRLAHGNVLANVRAVIAATRGDADLRALSWLPHFHDYGLVFGVLAPFVAGATSYLMSPIAFLRRPLSWLEAIARHGITHTGAPDSALATCVQALADSPRALSLRSLRSLTCGAEPVRAATVEHVLDAFGQLGMAPAALMPSYGLAEAVLGVTVQAADRAPRILSAQAAALRAHRFEPASPDDAQAQRLVECGPPVPETELRIVDPAGIQPCADGTVGEIWVRSPSVASGYWMQPAASEAIFGAFLADGSGPWLRTGDLGFVDDGALFVTGRLKDLVIVHGENHYPQDLEWTAERAHASLRPGHGVAFSVDGPGGEAVVLALELATRTAPAEPRQVFDAVRRAIAVAHGLPLHAVVLLRAGTLPRTSSGKLQRHLARRAYLAGELPVLAASDAADAAAALAPEAMAAKATGGEARQPCVPPRDAREQAIWEIWSDVLGTRAFGIHETFFELGGNSLRMTQALSRIQARLGVELPIADLFEHASVAALAAQLASRPGADGAQARASGGIVRLPRDGTPLPASLSQRRMWVIQQFDPSSTAYNVPISIRLRGAFDPAVCQQAFDLMVARHEGLRTALVLGEDGPVQVIAPALTVPIEFIDLGALPEPQRQATARELLSHRVAQPFDLSKAPLHRPTLIRLSGSEHVLFWLLHHAITDNWAGALLMREALAAYGALASGRTPEGAPPAIQYADYAAWERSDAAAAARQPHLDYWRERLRDLPDLDLPTEHHRPARASFRGARVSADLPPRLREMLAAFGQREAVTPFVTLLAAFALMLSRQARSDDVAIGTPIANRHRYLSEHLVGTLVNTLVMRTDLSGDPSFVQLVHRVRANALEAYAHQDAPFDDLIDALGHDRTLRPQGPVRVLFNVLNAPVGQLDFFGLEADEFDFERAAAQFDLSMHVDTEFTQRIHLEYATDLYSPVGATRMLENYLALVERLLLDPQRALSGYEMVSPAQMSLLRHAWNGAREPLPEPAIITRYLALDDPAVATRVAVIDAEGQTLSFADIDALSNRLAHLLRRRGIARGQRVGLCIPRGPDMLVAQLGVMKAGAAYVPLDPEYPIDRLRYMAADAELSAVLTHRCVSQILDGLDVAMLALDDPATTAGQPEHALAADAALDAAADDDAYVIYTSGSTGQPKGVRIQHRGVVNFLQGMVTMPGLHADDCVVAITSPSFDPSVLDLLLPLRVRARVVIASHAQAHDPAALRELLETHQATLLQATPSTWRMLIEAGWNGGPGFRGLIGGEALPPALAERLLARTGELWNIYGPTETTVWTTGWKVENPRAGITVGRQIPNTTVWVLDAHGHVCPIGVPGELCIGGAGVAPGYYRREALTAERFVPDPFGGEPGARLYRTGDLGRWRHDGLIEHLGRTDFQVKLRGHRIELGEIEAALLDHADVAHCVAVTRAVSEDDVRLVAYYVARAPAHPGAGALREHLRARLPHYMVPQHFVALDAMPQLPNGKVDRGALPAPEIEVVLADGRGYLAPQTPSEQVLCEIWSELLGIAQIGRTDNFFDLGGHSLLAMRAVALAEARLGWKITPRRMIFESLQQLARKENQPGGAA